ncbi:hypothetical protein EI94DRAFT_789712 [Lactarius quietus]|nr:hypothetical protein EI94DRAFT_789712 [Lactarius quietus]
MEIGWAVICICILRWSEWGMVSQYGSVTSYMLQGVGERFNGGPIGSGRRAAQRNVIVTDCAYNSTACATDKDTPLCRLGNTPRIKLATLNEASGWILDPREICRGACVRDPAPAWRTAASHVRAILPQGCSICGIYCHVVSLVKHEARPVFAETGTVCVVPVYASLISSALARCYTRCYDRRGS